jgi:hypothetical protein
MQSHHKSLGIVRVFIFLSWREGLVWLGYGCINTQGKDRISYSCRTVMIIPRSYFFNAALLT